MKVTTNDGKTFQLIAEKPVDFQLIGALDHHHSVYITSIGRNANNTSEAALLEVDCRGEKASAARDARQALQSLRDLFSLGLGHSADHQARTGRECQFIDVTNIEDGQTGLPRTHQPAQPPNDTPKEAYPCITAMLNCAKRMLIGNALIGNQQAVSWAQASIKTLNSLRDGTAQSAAALHQSKGGYDVPASWQAAWASLPIGVENFTMAQVQEFLGAKGVQLASNRVANRQINGVEQLKNDELAIVNPQDKHPATAADVDDGSALHAAPFFVEKSSMAEGGKA